MFSQITVISSDFEAHIVRIKGQSLVFRNAWGLVSEKVDIDQIASLSLHPGKHPDVKLLQFLALVALILEGKKIEDMADPYMSLALSILQLCLVLAVVFLPYHCTQVVFSCEFKDGRSMACKTHERVWKKFQARVLGVAV